VSHDRYFLDKLARRMFVLRPPGLVDFEGNYSGWAKRLEREREAENQRKAAAKSQGRPKGKAPSPPAPRTAKKGDDSYSRPFGRLTVEELEQRIAQTEKELAGCQKRCAEADAFRDAGGARALQKEYEELAGKLETLEEEYFTRET
jgi:ATPase subunit of ABC transporter with duplicated ATPase domains